jgi:hypothetical protein
VQAKKHETAHDAHVKELQKFNLLPTTPHQKTNIIGLTRLVGDLSNKNIISEGISQEMVHLITQLQPKFHLRNTRSKETQVTPRVRDELGALHHDMKQGVSTEQLISLLNILQEPTQLGTKLTRLKESGRVAHRNYTASRSQREHDQDLHDHVLKYKQGKGMLLKLLKPSKPKKARKRRAKKKAPNKKPKPEPIGPFRL